MEAAVLSLRQQRCVHHPQREASARCPECGRFYCRECITEHDDRVLCAACVARLSLKQTAKRKRWNWLPRLALAMLAFTLVFLIFLLLGNFLLSVPSPSYQTGGR